MSEILIEKGFVINSVDFSEIESIRTDLKESVIEKKEELSHQKCAILLNDLLHSVKLNVPLYDYVKSKYNIKLDFINKGEIVSEKVVNDYIFYIFSKLTENVEKKKEQFNIDMLDDFDLSCFAHFYPLGDKTLLIIETRQSSYLEVVEDHLNISKYSFDVSLEEPPSGFSYPQWAERAKDWLTVINRCGGNEDWVPSSGGFSVNLTENSFFIPDLERVTYYLSKMQDSEFDKMLDAMLSRDG